MTEHIYELVKVQNDGGPFAVPGEIVEIVTEDPYSKQSFIALVKISDDVLEDDESEEVPIDFAAFDGVGETVATRLKAAGYKFPSDLQDVDPDNLADEVKGLGPGRAENIIEKINE